MNPAIPGSLTISSKGGLSQGITRLPITSSITSCSAKQCLCTSTNASGTDRLTTGFFSFNFSSNIGTKLFAADEKSCLRPLAKVPTQLQASAMHCTLESLVITYMMHLREVKVLFVGKQRE